MSVIGIASGKGGTGKTTISTNAAWIIGSVKGYTGKIAYLELDLDVSNARTLLGAKIPRETVPLDVYITDPSVRPEETAVLYDDRMYVAVGSFAKSDLDLGQAVVRLKELIDFLQDTVGVKLIILDFPAGTRGFALTGLPLVDAIYMVTAPLANEVVGTAQAYSKYRKYIENAGLNVEMKGLILNRVGAQTTELTKEAITKNTGIPVVATVRYTRELGEAQKQGIPYARLKWGTDDPTLMDLIRVACKIIGREVSYKPLKKKGDHPKMPAPMIKSLLSILKKKVKR